MEKICESCTALRPVFYCKSDAAHLCLSCDAKVHSANALSSRHLRSLLCDLCRYRPAHVHCTDHRMFMCHSCDRSLHDGNSQHQKQLGSAELFMKETRFLIHGHGKDKPPFGFMFEK